MATKPGKATKHTPHQAARGREHSGSHEHRRFSGQELLRSQEYPPRPTPRRQDEHLRGSSSDRYYSTKDRPSRSQHLFDSKYLSKGIAEKLQFPVLDNPRYKNRLPSSGHGHASKGKEEQEDCWSTAAQVSRRLAQLQSCTQEDSRSTDQWLQSRSRSHAPQEFSTDNKQLSRRQEQPEYSTQVTSRSQRHLPYSGNKLEISESQEQRRYFLQKKEQRRLSSHDLSRRMTGNQVSRQGDTHARENNTGYLKVLVVHDASTELKEALLRTGHQPRGIFGQIGDRIDNHIYDLIGGIIGQGA